MDATLATTGRILRQLRHDPRTLVIVTVIPLFILTLLHYLFDERQPLASRAMPSSCGPLGAVMAAAVSATSMLVLSGVHAASGAEATPGLEPWCVTLCASPPVALAASRSARRRRQRCERFACAMRPRQEHW